MLGPATLDIEVKTLLDTLARGQWMPHEVTQIERAIRDRRAWLLGGLSGGTQSYWNRKLRCVDPNLRLRWDFYHGWQLDRWIKEWGCWFPVGTLGHNQIRPDLCDYLRSRDLQRHDADRYLQDKRSAAERIRRVNDTNATEKVLAAVDSMTDRRVREFIAVERAVQTGDTVIMHGETKEMFDRMVAAGEQAPRGPRSANPGAHPLRHRRKTGGKHIRE